MTDYFLAAFLIMIFTLSSQIYRKLNNSSLYRSNKENKIKSDVVFKSVYIWIKYSTLALLLSSIFFNEPKFLIFFSESTITLVGCLICLSSLAVFIKATKDLGSSYSPCYDSYKPKQLITNGIYSRVRHPIYSSNVLLLFGLFLISGNILVFVNTLVVIIFYYRASVFEEKEFIKTFPEYSRYSEKTKKFIPGVF